MIKLERYFGKCPEFDCERSVIVKYEIKEFLGGFKSYAKSSVNCEDENTCRYIQEHYMCPLIEKTLD